MSSIREVVRTALSNAGLGQYDRQAQPIVTVVEQREAECIGRLRDYAVNELSSVNESQIDQALDQCGFDMDAFRRFQQQQQQWQQRQQYATPADSQQQGDVGQQIADLQRQVQQLREAAQRNGISIS